MTTPHTNDFELDRYREYLLILARAQLGGGTGGKLEASDVVQQTLLTAHQKRDQFRGSGEAELAGWLRTILANNLANATRALHQACRDRNRERSLQAAVDQSAAGLAAYLAADQSSPSTRAVRNEQLLRLATALEALPDSQRDAMMWRYCHGLSLNETAERMGKTTRAVVGLLCRAAAQIREVLIEEPRE